MPKLEAIRLNQKTATKLALWAAATGVLISIYQRAVALMNLAEGDLPWHFQVLVFVSDFNWIYLGLLFFWATHLVWPEWRRKGKIGLIILSLVQFFFSVNTVLPYLYMSASGQYMVFEKFLAFLGVLWSLTVFLFAVVYMYKPTGIILRGLALLAGLEAILTMFLLLSIYPLSWIFFLNVLAVTLVAQWFWLLFLNGVPDN